MTPYRSKWPESKWLDYFWQASGDPAVDRLALLRQLSTVAVTPRDARPARIVRFWSRQARKDLKIRGRTCFSCRTGDRRLIWHHVIGVRHGGSGAVTNQVPLCEPCHAEVHPWLEPVSRTWRVWTGMHDLALGMWRVLQERIKRAG